MPIEEFDLIVVGGGAAGFFGAINAALFKPGLRVLILEKTTKLLSKVKISGGGRCNVTHHCFEPTPLSKHYPRGQRMLKQQFRIFQASDTVEWFEKRGVKLKTEEDGRMFPVTNNSQTIVNCFLREADDLKIKVIMSCEVTAIKKGREDKFEITCNEDRKFRSDKVLVAMGGHPKMDSYQWLAKADIQIVAPIPSLFTFNDKSKAFTDLMGVSTDHAQIKIAGTKFVESGPVLITHWGLSGPAVIKLSSWAAEYLHQQNYTFTALVNWLGEIKEDELRTMLQQQTKDHPKQRVITNPLFGLSSRLWQRLCELSQVEEGKIWAELPLKHANRLIEYLIRCPFDIRGKTTFKEEFVTCGGVDLSEIDTSTMESKKLKGLYFSGEVLHVDGETGGFNFQSAWTTAYLAAVSIAK